MGRGYKRKSGGRSSGLGINKKQKSHLKEYGELHPADEQDDGMQKYRKVEDVDDDDTVEVESSSSGSESEDEVETPFQQLLSAISANTHPVEVSDFGEETGDENVAGNSGGEEPNRGVLVEKDDGSEQNDSDVEDAEEDGDEDEDLSEEDENNSDNEVHSGNSGGDDDEDETLLKETDLFSIHFETDLSDEFVHDLEKAAPWEKEETKIQALGRCAVSHPTGTKKPNLTTNFKDFKKLRVRQHLADQIKETNKELGHVELNDQESFTPLQQSMFSVMNNYQDMYYPDQSPAKLEEIRLVYCTHALNHVLKTRSRVIAHNTKLKEKEADVNDDHRDQGLTRPKVLIVAPFRESASRIVNMFISLIHKGDQSTVMNRKKFVEEFKEEDEDDESEMQKKPEDYQATFQGNTDDHFRIGMSVAKKSLKLYSKFYSSDIIVASPLGLRTIIGAEGEDGRDFDFLSSIEVLIFDQTDIFLMQNWDHILHLMGHIHLQPKAGHGVDFSRVRMWTLNGWSKFYRQTLIFSSLASPEINSVFNKHCHNYAGKVLVPKVYTSGAICQIVTQLPQMFMRIECQTYAQLANVRFDFFVQKVLREHKDPVMARTMIFIPSYFDYVRIRNFFKKESIDFLSICEYTKDKKMQIARKKFMRGQAHFLLYTERFHFYHRMRVRGVKHLVFYELPRYPQLYAELCNMMMGVHRGSTDNLTCHVLYAKIRVRGVKHLVFDELPCYSQLYTELCNMILVVHRGSIDNLTCHVLYAKYDAQRLAAVVGGEHAGTLVTGPSTCSSRAIRSEVMPPGHATMIRG